MPAPRPLTFASVGEAPAEAERLLTGGYERRGNWDLRQVCDHCADWLAFPIDGYPPVPPWFKPALLAIRHTLGPRILHQILREGTMRAGSPTVARTLYPPAPDPAADAAAVERLARAADRFLAHEGKYAISPFFGRMSREEARGLQAIHTAHHFGFLEPK
ncbi:DUF1569 domain-containing protein [Alienimonas californiensis]|uniref:DinB superfamily protein n=1 Tax=Alienimonas californiensis TaxID=2527989 RepID=A0A517PF97_9PLAN|nr:DUF1569 domain-containing protein [Alienimonas californiensis]QDT18057.1 hypothetical protein CA12_41960 [Alienimonas californiensis]